MDWRDQVRKVVPYVPGEQPQGTGFIKLNTNENPYPPSPAVEKALAAVDADRFRLYPDPEAGVLIGALSERFGLPKDRFFVGAGSDDVLGMAFLTFFNGSLPVLFPDVTYSFYDVWADLFRIPYERVPLDEHYEIQAAGYDRPCGGIVIANPNAPTGLAKPLSFIREMVENHPDVVVIVDEAYVDFGGESAVGLIETYDNLLVVQTFSKSRAMAGMRIGYAIGNPELIAAMQAVKYSYNSYTMNLPAQIAGAASLKDEAYFKEQVDRVVATRERAKAALAELGFQVLDSKTNFLFCTHPEVDAETIFAALRTKKIIVRHFSGERVKAFLRISIGTDEQMDTLFAALKEIIGDGR